MRDKREDIQAAAALVATVVGAGFASGREVMRFFCVFGVWSWVGCVLAVAAFSAISAWTALVAKRLGAADLATLCRKVLGNVGGAFAAWIHGALIVTTAGAMIAAMGELAALSLPVHAAYHIGVVSAILIGAFFSGCGLRAIATMGWALFPVCALFFCILYGQPAPTLETEVSQLDAWQCIPMALAYAAMNSALGCGLFCEIGVVRTTRRSMRIFALAGGLLLLLLLGANGLLLRHVVTLKDAPMPIVELARPLGAVGYWLCIVLLSTAVMGTLLALLRTLRNMLDTVMPKSLSVVFSLVLPSCVGLLGFSALVVSAYPLLGAASTMIFVAIISKSIKERSHIDHMPMVLFQTTKPERIVKNEQGK